MRSLRIAPIVVLLVSSAGSCGRRAPAEGADAPERSAGPRTVHWTLACGESDPRISPRIYGIAGAGDESPHQWELGATARRWGGNASTRFNWRHGNAWNASSDWFFRNLPVSPRASYSWETFLDENQAHGIETALTVPMLGWVAKDATSYAFPVSRLGPQQSVAWDLPDAGNGVGLDGRHLSPGPPTLTSVRSTPEDIEEWVRRIRERDAARGHRSVHTYILDNEPTLWHQTHRDVRAEPVGYDELLERTITYAAAIRRADPDVRIAGPAAWGWLAYHFSARDLRWGTWARPDRLLHGNVPFIPWYLRRLREQEERLGTRLVDVLDVHFYPAVEGMGVASAGRTDDEGSDLRIRSTRALWDPSYVDESWIGEPMAVLPLLRRWVDENAPGMEIAIGEWNFGADTHASGGLAVAETLGRFGTERVDAAHYWTYPADRSPAFWAFRAYRNYDGRGARFLERSVPVEGGGPLTSLFASRDERGERAVVVVLNHDRGSHLIAELDAGTCRTRSGARAFTYAGGRDGFVPLPLERRPDGVTFRVAPWSISVIELDSGRGVTGGTRVGPRPSAGSRSRPHRRATWSPR